MKTICLSAGHQPGSDPGATYGGLKEADLNVKITRKAAEILRQHNIPVLEVPDTLNLQQTIAWINERSKQINICVEVHINAGKGTGVECWYYHDSAASKKLAEFITDATALESTLPNRGAKDEATNQWGRLGFIHDTKPLAALVECGFIDNEVDRKLLNNDEGLMRFSKGVARGILGYLGLVWVPPVSTMGEITPAPTPTPTPAPSSDGISERLSYVEKVCSELTDHIGEVERMTLDAKSMSKNNRELLLSFLPFFKEMVKLLEEGEKNV